MVVKFKTFTNKDSRAAVEGDRAVGCMCSKPGEDFEQLNGNVSLLQ